MIYVIVGAPGAGKTYFATKIALSEMKGKGLFRRCPRPVYTNFPVIDRKHNLSTRYWESSYVYENVQDSVIIIDEAYLDFSSRDYKNFDKDKQVFFAQNRHQGNDIYTIVQNASRVDLIVREMTNVLYYMHNVSLFGRPLLFIVDVIHDLNEMGKLKPSPLSVVKKKIFLFRPSVAAAYDTHAYRRSSPPFESETWKEKLKSQSIS
ncbi:MAG: zonular occludens toxin domain-containing protein [Paludibacter sp.]|nr:zonular occludens toxin domain-containing protein [Paludibacter sp.]MDD4429230.1 zonular occludens toxin domain-containing protein [Paludibacter sp.]